MGGRVADSSIRLAFVLGLLVSGIAEAQPESASRSHLYELDSRAAATAAVELRDGTFAWPRLDVQFDTAILEIEVAAKAPRRALPHVVVRHGEVEASQYVERRARGLRYLNLSALAEGGWPDAGEPVALEGWRVDVVAAKALHVFETPEVRGARVLVLAPHPDDAEIAAFAIYAESDSDVVTVTAGDAGGANFRSLYPSRPEHYRAKGWIRTLDSLVVPRIGGVAPGKSRNLGYYDATLHLLHAQPDTPIPPPYAELPSPGYFRSLNSDPELAGREFVGSWRSLVRDMERELERVKPDFVVLPHPHLDGHRDHQYTSVAALEALASTELDPVLLLYTNHATGAEQHPYGPRDAVASLPPSFDDTLPYDGVYSHPVAPDLQREKLFALEAMHDLRSFDLGERPRPRQHFRSWLRSLRRMFGAHRPSYSYYRRAARPNELFLVADRETALEIRRSFLERVGNP